MLQNSHSYRIQELIPVPSHLAHSAGFPALLRMRARSAAFMLQNSRPHPIQGLVLDLPTSRALHEGKEAWMGRWEKRIYHNEKLSRTGAKSQRDFDPKPGVARDEQPRVPVRLRFN